MSVYVDDLFRTLQTRQWRYPCAAHLAADSIEELDTFATLLGLQKRWRQDRHYDLTANKRLAAIKAGAIQVSRRRMAQLRNGTQV